MAAWDLIVRKNACAPCMPGTRTKLIDKINNWIADDARLSHVLWLSGGIGDGKSAVMETIRISVEDWRLFDVAAVFLGHGVHITSGASDETSPVWTATQAFCAIIYQFAERDAEYKRLLDPILRERNLNVSTELDVLFEAFLSDLLAFNSQKKRLVILDGVDESHIPLLKLICSTHYDTLQILWIIAIRYHPIPSVKLAEQITGHLLLEMPSSQDAETRKDIEYFLREELQGIRGRYSETLCLSLEEKWPEQTDLAAIVRASSYNFTQARTIVSLVEEHLAGNIHNMSIPNALMTIDTPDSPPDAVMASRYFPMDKVHRQILMSEMFRSYTIPLMIVAITAAPFSLSSSEISLLLHRPKAVIDEVVYELRSIVHELPGEFPGGRRPLFLAHSPFLSFINNSNRSGLDPMDRDVNYVYLISSCLSAIERMDRIRCLREVKVFGGISPLADVLHCPSLQSLHYVSVFSITNVWDFMQELSPHDYFWLAERLSSTLHLLRRLSGHIPLIPFLRFLYWARSNNNYFVRTAPTSVMDKDLTAACSKIAAPFDFSTPSLPTENLSELFAKVTAKYVLLGTSRDPVVAVLIEEGVTIYSCADICEL